MTVWIGDCSIEKSASALGGYVVHWRPPGQPFYRDRWCLTFAGAKRKARRISRRITRRARWGNQNGGRIS